MSLQRRAFITLLGASAAAWPLAARAQQGRVTRIGYLGAATYYGQQNRIEAFRAGLRDLGYVEGRNVFIDFRWAEGRYERLPELAAELVRLNVDIIVTSGTPGARAAKRASTTIPIVVATIGDAVANGIVASLNRPGGNITGSSFLNPELSAKRLELIKETVPRASHLGFLLNGDNYNDSLLELMEPAAAALKFKLHQFPVRGPNEFEGAFAAMVRSGVDMMQVEEDAMLTANLKSIAEHAARNRLPSISGREFAEAGGLMGYGANLIELSRRAAVFVDKILKGAKPSDLPVEQPTKFEFIINRKTARILGIDFPLTLLLRVDEVIE
jgi:ABC-type uncharacterized transport system substrate-binding protein